MNHPIAIFDNQLLQHPKKNPLQHEETAKKTYKTIRGWVQGAGCSSPWPITFEHARTLDTTASLRSRRGGGLRSRGGGGGGFRSRGETTYYLVGAAATMEWEEGAPWRLPDLKKDAHEEGVARSMERRGRRLA
jgi:hypothetical protein